MSGLNEPQREAVEHGDGPLVIFATAGSGKTRCLTRRIATLINRGVAPGRILAVTFTNKAANELRERLDAMVGEQAKSLHVGTFHATCARILRGLASHIGRTNDYVIYDDADQNTLIKQIVEELRLDKEHYAADDLALRIQQEKQRATSPDELERLAAENGLTELESTFIRVWRKYEDWMKSCNALDFEDLILCTMRLAESEDLVGEKLRSKYHHVLVDEYQDTNHTQYRLVRAFGSSRNICVVGDDSQSIYSWRGAEVRNIREFHLDYPDAKVIKLEQNYRSTKRIVAVAQAIIGQSKDCVQKNAWTANEDGAHVTVIETVDDRAEATFVAKTIQSALELGESPHEIAILYRTHAQSRSIEEELRLRGVPYQVIGGLSFYDRMEVKDILSYLRLIQNPRSDVDLLRVINTPTRGIGSATLRRIADIAASRNSRLFDALEHAAVAPEIRRSERENISRFQKLISELSKAAPTMRPSDIVKRVLTDSGYRRMWESDATENTKLGRAAKAKEAGERVENLDEFINGIASYEKVTSDQGDTATLRSYLERVSLLTSGDEKKDKNRVSMMTGHAVKGLEFNRVFLVGVEDGRLPLKHAILKASELEEERRLAYVMITRARKHLTISHAQTRFVRGELQVCRPSRFLSALPPQSVSLVAQEGEHPLVQLFADLRSGLQVLHRSLCRRRLPRQRASSRRASVIVLPAWHTEHF